MSKGMTADEAARFERAIQTAELLNALLIVIKASDKEEAVKLLEERLKA